MSPYPLSYTEQRSLHLVLIEFEVTENGFLPAEQPLASLSNPYYCRWEDLAANLPELVKSRRIREEIRQLPILSTEKLHGEYEWRRAYVVLAFMTHAFIWGDDVPGDVSCLLKLLVIDF